MVNSTPGKIRDGLWLLGREESCVYLLEGSQASMIVSGGLSLIVPDVIEQIKVFGINETKIHKLLILHAHFDHVGIIPFFKRRLPTLEIYASERAWEILKTPKAVKTINAFNRDVAKRVGREELHEMYDLDWRDDIKGDALQERDCVDLGDLEIEIYETPGHSSCSISAYVPRFKALFASDAGGIPFKETIITSGNSNFTLYQRSLEKLKDLDVAYLCADHYGYLTGKEAKGFTRRSISEAKKKRVLIEEVYQRTDEIDATTKELVHAFFQENPDYFLSPEIFEGVYRQMVRHIAGALDSSREDGNQ
jgi:glyoxylase-like metal-dependent hydrolase (beta-lactamase superfamily II)